MHTDLQITVQQIQYQQVQSLTTNTVRRYANTGTIDSTTAGNAYDGTSGTVSVNINGTVDGHKHLLQH